MMSVCMPAWFYNLHMQFNVLVVLLVHSTHMLYAQAPNAAMADTD